MKIAGIKDILIGGSKRTATVKRNILGSLAIKVVSILTSFLLVPMTLGYVSSEIYGVWLTISSILHWLTYMDVGVTHGLKNRLNECLARKDYEKGKSLVSTTYAIMFAMFVPLSVLLIVASPWINWCRILNVDSSNQEIIIKTMQVLFVFIALQMIVNVFVAVVAAYQKTALSSLFAVIGQICSLCIIGMMTLFVKPSLLNLAFAYSLMPILIVLIASVIYFKTTMKEVAPTFKSINTAYIKDLWGLGIMFFIIQVQMIVLYQATNILISHIAGPESVTQYNIAYKLLNIVVMVYTIILNPLWPAFTDAYTKKDYLWMNNMYKKMQKLYLLLCIMISVIVILSPFLIKLWVGDKVSVPFMLTLSIAVYTLIHCWDTLQVTLINGTGKVELQSYVILIGLLLHVPLSLFLGKYIGILGVVASMSIINIIYASFFTIQIRRILNNSAIGIWNK
ncbi:MAG: oligosaccharide flippase family protein [Bacteroidaceae bacterium]|nr:oligosaccharide flippase family protein [Bacteroidaceae bacterium]